MIDHRHDIPLQMDQPMLLIQLDSPEAAPTVLGALSHPLMTGEYTYAGSTACAVYLRRTDAGAVAEAAATVARQAWATAVVTGVRLSMPLSPLTVARKG